MNLTPNPLHTLFSLTDYMVFPGPFESEKLDYWIETMEDHQNEFEEAGVGGGGEEPEEDKNPETRSGIVKWFHYDIEDAFTIELFQELLNFTKDVNDNYYRFDLHGFEMIQYTKYTKEGDHYTWHCDKFEVPATGNPNTFASRKLSFSLLLNQYDEDYEGGKFWVNNSGNPIELEVNKGDIVVFPSFTLHKVAPVESGERKSLVWWCQGPKFR